MIRLHVGAVLERPPGSKYRSSLSYAELRVVGPPPRPGKLAGWRDEQGDAFSFGLIVPTVAARSERGAFRLDEDSEAALQWTVDAAKALDARWLVLRTGADFTTGQRDRDRMDRWLEHFEAPLRERLVWHPSGLWDAELAIPFAKKRGLVRAFDPTEDGPGPGVTYARLRAMGKQQRFSETVLLDVVDALEGSEEAWVTVDSGRSFDEAKRLMALFAEE